jgi:hypothetical protein
MTHAGTSDPLIGPVRAEGAVHDVRSHAAPSPPKRARFTCSPLLAPRVLSEEDEFPS